MEGCIGNSLFANALIAAREKFKVPPDLFANNGNAVEANAEQVRGKCLSRRCVHTN
ncbi:unnamed protein product [Gongylonema pulchrum]|uniref:PALP domain-containing protein n=1 Tax=Gongylonema pulchrum TaxID=637853 RepID=A0A183DYC3_9BILA|nr:unnamed protein product [Gongylonema pulchrum]